MIIYVAGAYKSRWGKIGVFFNIIKAWRTARRLWKRGYTVICPHANTAFMDCRDLSPLRFIAGDLEILGFCDAVLMLDGWQKSRGAKMEYYHAVFALGVPAFFSIRELLAFYSPVYDYA